jgi:AI-2 transport protein TqsA
MAVSESPEQPEAMRGGGGAGAGAPAPSRDVALRSGLTVMALSLLILVLGYLILREMTVILRPLLIAVFVCYLIVPAHRWLVRHRLPSLVSYFVIVGAFVSVMYFVGSLAFRSLSEISAELPTYVYQLEAVVDHTIDKFKTDFRLGDEQNATEDATVTDTEPPAPAPTTTRAPSPQRRLVTNQLISIGQTTLETFVGIFTGALVVLFYLIFLLAEVAGFEQRLVNAFGRQRAEHAREVIGTINLAVSRYIAVKTFISLLVAGITGAVLYSFGVRYAFTWAMITFFANFIPYIGSMVAVTLPIAMSAVQFGEPGRPFAIAVLLIVAQQATGSYLEPRIVGERLGVSPLIILLSLAFWGYLWGIPGMILSAPLAVTMKIVLENVETTKPIAKLLSNR